jgi:hypothetical protein
VHSSWQIFYSSLTPNENPVTVAARTGR